MNIARFGKLLFYGATLFFVGCDNPTELPGAWTIVKQTGHENYGFVTELGNGFVQAGYTNKASAEAAMKEARWNYRHPPNPEPQKTWWEVQ